MIRLTILADTEPLIAMTDATGMFKPLEIEALHEVLDDFFAENQARNHQAITCDVAGEVVGFAYYAPADMTDRTWHVYWIVVSKNHQGRGIGGAMLRYLEDDIRTKHFGRVLFIETGSMPHYEPTREFYRKQGYEQHALLADFYADGDNMVVFRKSLNK